jgi:ATP-binding cassette subfamily B protein
MNRRTTTGAERRRVVRHMLAVSWREDRGGSLLVLLLIAVGSLVVAATGWSQRLLVDAAEDSVTAGVVWAAVLGAAAFGIGAAADRVMRYRQGDLIDRIDIAVNEEILERTGRIPSLTHLERSDYLDRVGLLRSMTRDLSSGWWALASAVGAVVSAVLSLLLLIGVHPLLGLLAPLALPPLWAARRGHRHSAAARKATAEAERHERALHRLCLTPDAAREITVSGAATVLDAAADAATDSVIRRAGRARTAAALWQLGGWSCYAAGYTAGLLLVAHLVSTRQAGLGDLMLLITLGARLRGQVNQIVSEYSRTADARLATEHYLWLSDHAAAEAPTGTSPPPGELAEGIRFDGVGFSYPGTDSPVLTGLDLRLRAGSTVAVVGVNGAGKTTLVKLLTGMYRPSSGAITVDGTPLETLDLEAWRRRCSGVFQDFVPFELPVGASIGIGDLPRAEDSGAIRQAAAAAGAEQIVAGLPEGYDTVLGRVHDGIVLSHGQAQRIALARGAMRQRPLLRVLDEPTAALDAHAEHELYERYVDQATGEGGLVTVLVSHRFSTVRMADHIVVLADGRIAEQGSHRELLASDGAYAELYRAQADGYRD